MSDSVIIIPTYNEKENIEAIIRAVTSLEKDFDVLVIDDGSPDGTAAIVKGLMAGEFKGRVNIVERSGKLGLGTAYICGFSGRWSTATSTSSRWMPTSPTHLPTCRACMPHATTRGTTFPWEAAILQV